MSGIPVELILARNLADHLSSPVFVLDAVASLAWFNDAAAAILGRAPGEVAGLGTTWTSLLDSDDPLDFLTADRPEARLIGVGRGARAATFMVSVVPLRGHGSVRVGTLVIFDADARLS